MYSRKTRRADRTKSRPTSKTKIKRGNFVAALVCLIPLVVGIGLVWHARAQASNLPAAQADEPVTSYDGTRSALAQNASTTSAQADNTSRLDLSDINSYATDSDVSKMNDPSIHEVDAKNLKPGDAVVLKDGRTAIVESVQMKTVSDDTTVASDTAPTSDKTSNTNDGDEWILAPDNVPPPLPNGDPAPLPVPRSDSDPGFHPLKVQKQEVRGKKIILSGVNPATGKDETVIGIAGRDTVYDLGDPNKGSETGVIQNVRVGDYVVTRNPITGKNEFKQVTQTYKHLAYETITAKFADAKTGKIVDALTATPEHPFFVPGRGAIPLGELSVGTQVMTLAGPPLVIASLIRHSYPQGIPVFNFEVQGDHTYFVGQANGGIWVHNDCTAIAQGLKDAGNPGEIYRLEINPSTLPEPEMAENITLGGAGRNWNYHDVLYDAEKGQVYDPMTYGHSNPVPFETWAKNFPYWDSYRWGPVQ